MFGATLTAMFLVSLVSALATSPCNATPNHQGKQDAERAPRAAIKQGNLKVGDAAPEFNLSNCDGKNPIALSSLRGKPVVLVFGSCTCPPFVESSKATEALYQQFKDRVNFLMVYISEAHATDGPRALPRNQFQVATPKTMDARCAIAQSFDEKIKVSMPLVVDTIDDATQDLYAPWPNRMYILDAGGKIVDVGSAGPQGTKTTAKTAPDTLNRLLAKSSEPASPGASGDKSKSDTTKSDTAKSDTTKSDTTKSDTTKSDTTKSDTAKSDTTKSDTTKSDTTKSDTTDPDTKDKANKPSPPKHGVEAEAANLPGPWDNDVLIYALRAGDPDRSSDSKKLGSFSRAGVSTVARMKDDRLIAAFQNFPPNDESNFDRIAVSFSSDEGKSWTTPSSIEVTGMDAGSTRPFDPTLVTLPDGRIRVYFTSNASRDLRQSPPKIYSAVGDDGVHYQFEPGVRFEVEEKLTIDCAVALHDGVLHMIVPDNGNVNDFMEANRQGNAPPPAGNGFYATSKDGLAFERVADLKMPASAATAKPRGGRSGGGSGAGARWLGNMQSDDGKLVFFGSGPGPWPIASADGKEWAAVRGLPSVLGADPGAVKLKDGSWLVLVTSQPRAGTPSATRRKQ